MKLLYISMSASKVQIRIVNFQKYLVMIGFSSTNFTITIKHCGQIKITVYMQPAIPALYPKSAYGPKDIPCR